MRHALAEWPAAELVNAVRKLPPTSATVRDELGDLWDWNHMAANLAELVDLMTYWLQSEYQKWVTDPDDPDVKRQLEQRKRSKAKPPPYPLIPPVAHRPASVAKAYETRFAKQVAELGVPPAKADGPAAPNGRQWVTSDEFDLAIGALN